MKGREWKSYLYTMHHSEYRPVRCASARLTLRCVRSATSSDVIDCRTDGCMNVLTSGLFCVLCCVARSRRYLGSEQYCVQFFYSAGSSQIEPGVTPAQDTLMSYATWTDFVNACVQSRQNAGVHFTASALNDIVCLCFFALLLMAWHADVRSLVAHTL
jgi:hypothetical protein